MSSAPLTFLRRYPWCVGGSLTYLGLFISVIISQPLEATLHLSPTSIFALCMTPAAFYADYLHVVRGTYVTLIAWLSLGIGYLTWNIAVLFHLDQKLFALNADERYWYRCIGGGSFFLAVLISRIIYAWLVKRE